MPVPSKGGSVLSRDRRDVCRHQENSDSATVKEPLMPHEAPTLLWEKVGVDIAAITPARLSHKGGGHNPPRT